MAGRFSYSVTARSSASPEVVFATLSDVPGMTAWAPAVTRASYEREGEPAPGGVGAIRRIGRNGFYGRERVLVADAPHHHAYEVLSGVPVRNYRADVRMEPDGDGTRIAWSATFDPKIPGTGRLLERFFTRFIGRFATALAAEAARRVR